MLALIVTEPFNGYEKGASIRDPKEITAVLDSENQSHVVKVNLPEEPTKKG